MSSAQGPTRDVLVSNLAGRTPWLQRSFSVQFMDELNLRMHEADGRVVYPMALIFDEATAGWYMYFSALGSKDLVALSLDDESFKAFAEGVHCCSPTVSCCSLVHSLQQHCLFARTC